ncbi:hypothetical protein T265_13354, partial [Opisthorchis viverrini]
ECAAHRPPHDSVGTIFEISRYIFIKETTHKVAENSSTAHDRAYLMSPKLPLAQSALSSQLSVRRHALLTAIIRKLIIDKPRKLRDQVLNREKWTRK